MTPTIGRLAIQQRDQRAERRPPADEGARPIDRVQHPAQPSLRPLEAEFLPQDPVVREPLRQHRAHRLLGGAVGDGHRRAVGLRVDRHIGAEERPHHRACHIGRGLGGGDEPIELRRTGR